MNVKREERCTNFKPFSSNSSPPIHYGGKWRTIEGRRYLDIHPSHRCMVGSGNWGVERRVVSAQPQVPPPSTILHPLPYPSSPSHYPSYLLPPSSLVYTQHVYKYQWKYTWANAHMMTKCGSGPRTVRKHSRG